MYIGQTRIFQWFPEAFGGNTGNAAASDVSRMLIIQNYTNYVDRKMHYGCICICIDPVRLVHRARSKAFIISILASTAHKFMHEWVGGNEITFDYLYCIEQMSRAYMYTILAENAL